MTEDQQAELFSSLLKGEVPADGVYLAVGIPKGTVAPSDGSESTSWVRAGGRNVPLVFPVYSAWLFALTPLIPAQLSEVASDAGVDDPEEFRIVMEESGLLLRIDSTTSLGTLSELRVIPLGLGLGNDPQQPDVYEVTDTRTVLRLSGVANRFWRECDGNTTIGDACDAVATGIASESPHSQWNKGLVLAQVPGFLAALMAARLVFIDGQIRHEILA